MQNKKGFTLVELIVVITILAILGTISFLSFQGYSKSARDSKRLSDVNNIEKSLELFMLQTGKYPLPDNSESVTYSGGTVTVWDQGTVGDTVSTQLSRNLNEKPVDPLFQAEYTYSTTPSRIEYEIMSVYESDIVLNNMNQAQAATSVTVRIDGTYNGVYVRTGNYIIPTPSIITALDPNSLDFNATTIESQVVSRGTNIPNIGSSSVTQSTGGLTFGTLEVYNGTLDKNTSDTEWINAYDAVANTYNGSSLQNDTTVQVLLSKTTDEEKIAFTQTIVLDTKEAIAATNTQSEGPTLTGWRALDPNCQIDDIVIGGQTWAGCNSTLGTGLEYGQIDADIGTSNYNGELIASYGCYGYDSTTGNNNSDCILGSSMLSSNGSTKEYFEMKQGVGGSNSSGDSEFDTIWGKMYRWSNSSSACPTGRSVPTDAQWTTLENTLNGSSCRTGDGWQCGGLSWNGHNAKTDTNNLANALKLPLAGSGDNVNNTFGYRGYYTYIWSSTPSSTNAYYRYLGWDISWIHRSYLDKNYPLTVRCIKDPS